MLLYWRKREITYLAMGGEGNHEEVCDIVPSQVADVLRALALQPLKNHLLV